MDAHLRKLTTRADRMHGKSFAARSLRAARAAWQAKERRRQGWTSEPAEPGILDLRGLPFTLEMLQRTFDMVTAAPYKPEVLYFNLHELRDFRLFTGADLAEPDDLTGPGEFERYLRERRERRRLLRRAEYARRSEEGKRWRG